MKSLRQSFMLLSGLSLGLLSASAGLTAQNPTQPRSEAFSHENYRAVPPGVLQGDHGYGEFARRNPSKASQGFLFEATFGPLAGHAVTDGSFVRCEVTHQTDET